MVKVKVHPVQALRLCTGRTVHMVSRGIALPFHDHGTRKGEGSASRPGHSLPPGKTWYPLYRRLGGPPGPVWTDAENLAPTGIRSPGRPARSQSPYRLSYRGPPSNMGALLNAVINVCLPLKSEEPVHLTD
jgi:hypothetical protein